VRGTGKEGFKEVIAKRIGTHRGLTLYQELLSPSPSLFEAGTKVTPIVQVRDLRHIDVR
jgi:hypothetical protein